MQDCIQNQEQTSQEQKKIILFFCPFFERWMTQKGPI
jgi:hypothetical protein